MAHLQYNKINLYEKLDFLEHASHEVINNSLSKLLHVLNKCSNTLVGKGLGSNFVLQGEKSRQACLEHDNEWEKSL